MAVIRFTAPWTPFLSKNKRFAYKGKKVKDYRHLAAQNIIAILFKEQLRNFSPPLKGKVWIGFSWFRESMRGDIQNFINPMVDAIFANFDFDDNWCCISELEWFIDKKNPRFEITVRWE